MIDYLYHYTSLKGFSGIMNTSDDCISLWFTHCKYLNDSSEGNELQRIFKACIEELHKDSLLSEEDYKQFIDFIITDKKLYDINYKIDEYNSEVYLKECEDDTYICSFCTDGDLLDMWRYYSKGDVGVSLKIFLPYFSIDNNIYESYDGEYISHFNIAKVIYDDNEKRRAVKEKILDAFKKPDPVNGVKGTLNSNLANYRFLFKNTCFSSEKGIRMILSVPKDYDRINQLNRKTFKINYRCSGGLYIPYICLDFPKLSLHNVIVSPTASHLNVESIRRFLQQFGVDADVEQSTLPVRY